jgi:hypothetical protein
VIAIDAKIVTARLDVSIMSINPFVADGSRRFNRSEMPNGLVVKNEWRHHFRFPPPPQVNY